MRGYNVVEVDEFLDMITLDLQKLLEEQEKLRATVKNLESELSQYKRSETSVMNTLESAKKLMNDISESAEKRAEIIIKNAQMDAEAIQRDARENISKLTEEGEKLKYKVARFKERYRQLLEDQLNQIEGSSEELFEDLEREFMPASMDDSAAKAPQPAAPEVQVKRFDKSDTMVVSESSLEEMLMENYGLKQDDVKSFSKEDLAKTRVIR